MRTHDQVAWCWSLERAYSLVPSIRQQLGRQGQKSTGQVAVGGQCSIGRANMFRRPIPATTGQAILRVLALEIARCFGELRSVDVVEGIYVDDSISSSLNRARYDGNYPARLAHVEIGCLGSETVLGRLGRIGNGQPEAAIGMGCPNAPVFSAVVAAACADRDRGPRRRPVERETDVAAVTAAVDLSEEGLLAHGNVQE